MTSLRYLDSLDTVRSHWGGTFPHLAKAEMISWLLQGNTILLSETQAFDSLQVLEYANDTSFLELMRAGFIQVLPFVPHAGAPVQTPLEAFKRRLADNRFHFSAWTGIPTPPKDAKGGPDLSSEQAQMRAAILAQSQTRSFSDGQIGASWDSLERLNSAHLDHVKRLPAPLVASMPPPHVSLHGLLDECRKYAKPTGNFEALDDLCEAVTGNNRSDYHHRIEAGELSEDERHFLHSVVNLSYNTVIAHSLGAEANLTTARHDAEEVMGGAIATLGQGVASSAISALEVPNEALSSLEPISWKTLADWLPELSRFTPQQRTRTLLEQASKQMSWEIASHKGETRLVWKCIPSLAGAGVHATSGVALSAVAVAIGISIEGAVGAALALEFGVALAAKPLAEKLEKKAEHGIASLLSIFERKNVLSLLEKGFPVR